MTLYVSFLLHKCTGYARIDSLAKQVFNYLTYHNNYFIASELPLASMDWNQAYCIGFLYCRMKTESGKHAHILYIFYYVTCELPCSGCCISKYTPHCPAIVDQQCRSFSEPPKENIDSEEEMVLYIRHEFQIGILIFSYWRSRAKEVLSWAGWT